MIDLIIQVNIQVNLLQVMKSTGLPRRYAPFHEQQCDAVNNQEDGHKTRPYSREWYGLSGYSCSLSVCGIPPDTGGSQ